MKKRMILSSLLLCAALLLTGCGDKALSDTAATGTTEAVTTTKRAFISEEQAMALAADHWGFRPGDRDPDTDELLSMMVVEQPTEGNPVYRVLLRRSVETKGGTAQFTTIDVVAIDALTGTVLDEPQ